MTTTAVSADTELRKAGLEIVLLSFLVLFQELALIRWIASQVRVVAYFPNIVLLSAFLGLGIGCLRSGRRSALWAWPFLTLLLVAACLFMSSIVFTQENASEHLWLLYYDLPKDSLKIPSIKLPILVLFVLSTLSFIPLGQAVAARLQVFRNHSRPLMGYVFDLTGSICGVIGFAIISMAGVFPVWWFAVVLSLGCLFFSRSVRRLVWCTLAAGAIVVLVARQERFDEYSPYYALARVAENAGSSFSVLTNGSLHQVAMDLRRESRHPAASTEASAREGYHFPYTLLGDKPKTALVLGAGTGNDVAVLLDQGISTIDAVEIDPVIIEWGRKYHPNAPYDSPNVTVVNNDARTFLNNTTKKYDVIVFGTLDSQTRLSALSSVRLDNFIYTVETIRAARDHLSETGGIVMYFMVGEDYIRDRIIGMLTQVFGEVPFVYSRYHQLFNHVFLTGPAFSKYHSEQSRVAGRGFVEKALPFLDMPEDDWPYLYLEKRGISGFYLSMMALIALLSIVGVAFGSRTVFRSMLKGVSVDGEMFFFGLAFLLLETRSVTAMNLVWGATWITSAVVFGSVLLMVLFATVLSGRVKVPFGVSMTALVGSLIITYFIPVDACLGNAFATKLVFSTLLVGTPIFFASLCFANVYSSREHVDQAFGWNLIGSVCGGLLEFLAMSVGFRALLLVAAAVYLSALLVRLRAKRIS